MSQKSQVSSMLVYHTVNCTVFHHGKYHGKLLIIQLVQLKQQSFSCCLLSKAHLHIQAQVGERVICDALVALHY